MNNIINFRERVVKIAKDFNNYQTLKNFQNILTNSLLEEINKKDKLQREGKSFVKEIIAIEDLQQVLTSITEEIKTKFSNEFELEKKKYKKVG